jgi:hypothetical protein
MIFTFTLPTYYLFVNDYLLFDIFYSHLYSRSLHFTFKETSPVFEPYMIQTGYVYKVIPVVLK